MTLTSSLGYSNTEEPLRMGPSQLDSTSVFIRGGVKESGDEAMSRRRSALMSHGCWQIPPAQPQERAISAMTQAYHLSQSYDNKRKQAVSLIFPSNIWINESEMHNAVLSSGGDAFCTVRRKLRQSRVKGKKGCFELFVSSKLTLSNAIARGFWSSFVKQRLSCTKLKLKSVCSLPSKQKSLCIQPKSFLAFLTFGFSPYKGDKVSARLVFRSVPAIHPRVSEKQEKKKKPWMYLRMFPWNHSWQPADIKPELWPCIGCTQSSFGDLRSQHLPQWVFELTRRHALMTGRTDIFVFAELWDQTDARSRKQNWNTLQERCGPWKEVLVDPYQFSKCAVAALVWWRVFIWHSGIISKPSSCTSASNMPEYNHIGFRNSPQKSVVDD